MKKTFVLAFFLVFFFLFSGTSFAKEANFASEEIIVKYDLGASISQIGKINEKFGATIKERLNLPSTFVLKVPPGMEKETARIFSLMPNVKFAEPNYEMTALLDPNDPNFSDQWGLKTIQAPLAWDITSGSSGVKIAIVDTGIDKDHPDLSPKVDSWINYSSSRSSDDLYGHGTHVAGIAAAITNNGLGVAGTGFNTHLLSVKVLDDSGSGYTSSIANGITWAANNGARVINLSLGGGSTSKTLEDAINYAWNNNVVVVCAAGNDGKSLALYPAYYQNCIAVAVTDENDQKTSWSNYGSWVDVAAPGLDIYSTLTNHKSKMTSTRNYGYASGTSMATPFVAGLAGLIFGENPSLTNVQVRSIIENTSDKISGTGTYWVFGRINAYSAVLGFSSTLTATPTPLVTFVPTATPSPTIILVLTSTPVPTITPTPTPTNTPKPTSTSAPTPTVNPNPTPTPWYCKNWPQFCK